VAEGPFEATMGKEEEENEVEAAEGSQGIDNTSTQSPLPSTSTTQLPLSTTPPQPSFYQGFSPLPPASAPAYDPYASSFAGGAKLGKSRSKSKKLAIRPSKSAGPPRAPSASPAIPAPPPLPPKTLMPSKPSKTVYPTVYPTFYPTVYPSRKPSRQPSRLSSNMPTRRPSPLYSTYGPATPPSQYTHHQNAPTVSSSTARPTPRPTKDGCPLPLLPWELLERTQEAANVTNVTSVEGALVAGGP